MRRLFRGSSGEGARFTLFLLLLLTIALCGGSSRPDAWQLLPLRPIAVLLATSILVLPGPFNRSVLRGPGLLLAALGSIMLLQLVPLPPAIWTMLPGHGFYTATATLIGTAQPWRPVTLSVDLTLNSLVALGVPAAVLLSAAALRADQRSASAGLMVGIAVFSAVLGLLQITLGPSFYFYAPTDIGRPAGLFAHINHQAAVLAATIPIAAAWGIPRHGREPFRIVVAAGAGTLLLATVLVTGSRSGLILAALAIVIVPLVVWDRLRLAPGTRWLIVGGAVAVPIVLVTLTWLAGRLNGLDRLLGGGQDQRIGYLPITWRLFRDFNPVGSGFGTFDMAFRRVEPDRILKLTYFNHAHNDLLELGITGGSIAVAVALVYLVWLVRRGAAAFGMERHQPTAPLARAGLFAVLLLLLASLVDYPLRTPLAAAILALASLWVASHRPAR